MKLYSSDPQGEQIKLSLRCQLVSNDPCGEEAFTTLATVIKAEKAIAGRKERLGFRNISHYCSSCAINETTLLIEVVGSINKI